MTHVLIAGVVANPPKVFDFPSTGVPRATVTVRVDDMLYAVVGHEMQAAQIEALLPGDALCVQGQLTIETSKAKEGGQQITGLRITADQVTPLRKRTIKSGVAVAAMR